jgi:hypothetical protein
MDFILRFENRWRKNENKFNYTSYQLLTFEQTVNIRQSATHTLYLKRRPITMITMGSNPDTLLDLFHVRKTIQLAYATSLFLLSLC